MQHESTFMRKLSIVAVTMLAMIAMVAGLGVQKAYASGNTAVTLEKSTYEVTISGSDTITAYITADNSKIDLSQVKVKWTVVDPTIAKLGMSTYSFADDSGVATVPFTGLKVGSTRVKMQATNASGGVVSTQYAVVKVVKKTQAIKVATRIAAVNYNGSITKAAYPIKSATAEGAITYTKVSGSKYLSITTAGKTTGKVTVQPKTPVGEYTITIGISAAETDEYAAAYVEKTVKVQVKRFTPTITVSKASPYKNYSATKAQTVKLITRVQCAAQPVSYSIVSVLRAESGKSYKTNFDIDASTGLVTFKAGTPKGTYKVQIKVTSPKVAGCNSNYKTVTATFKIV